MITTVSINPAIDKTLIIDDFNIGCVNRASKLRVDAAGKGINVSKGIQRLGGKSKAIGILGGNAGMFIKNELDRMKIQNDFLFINGETRTNIKIVDNMNHLITDINENGPLISEYDLKKFEIKVKDALLSSSVAVFSGSVPKSVDKGIYGKLIRLAKLKGVKTIVDADGELLIEAIKEGPDIVKPNIHELGKIFSKEIKAIEEIVHYGQKILENGVNYAVVSCGEDGAIFLSKSRVAVVQGIKVEVKSTVGAGDAMVAAMAIAVDSGYSFEETIRLAVAASAASVMQEGTQFGGIEDINSLKKKVDIKIWNGGL